jgi:hypothetical protein
VCSSSIGFIHEAPATPTTHTAAASTPAASTPAAASTSTAASESTSSPPECGYAPRGTSLWSEEWNGKTTPEQRNRCRQQIVSSREMFSAAEKNKEGGRSSNDAESGVCGPQLCSECQLPLRPKVIMFGDTCPNVMARYNVIIYAASHLTLMLSCNNVVSI